MKNYFTEEGFPVKSNSSQPGWTEVTEEVFNAKVKELNDKADADKKKQDEDMKLIRDQDKRIQDKLREMALKELKEDDLRDIKKEE